jgi:hypothetical protein
LIKHIFKILRIGGIALAVAYLTGVLWWIFVQIELNNDDSNMEKTISLIKMYQVNSLTPELQKQTAEISGQCGTLPLQP